MHGNISSRINDFVCEELLKLQLLVIANDTLRQQYYPDAPTVWKKLDYVDAIKIFACMVIIVGGLLGNMIVILTVALNRSMRNSFNFYIANLAVTDAIICIICMGPRALVTMTEDSYVLGPVMCKFHFFTQMACLTSSVLTLSAISCDRFMAVMFPLRVRFTTQRTPVVLSIVWIVSVAVSVPFSIVARHIVIRVPICNDMWPMQWYYDESLQKCIYHSPLRTIYYVVLSVTLFFLPILIMITAYSLILRRLSTAKVPGERHASNANVHSRARKKVTKMVFVMIVVFTICWTPFQILILYGAFKRSQDAMPQWIQKFVWSSAYLAFANSFMNPIIYTGFSEDFREAFRNVLRCGYKKSRHGKPAGPQTFHIDVASSSSQNTVQTLDGSIKSESQATNVGTDAADGDISTTTKEVHVSVADTKESGTLA